jgi:hypothetical protein
MWRQVVASLLLVITTQNVRHTLPAPQARHDIHQAARHGSVLVTQEMGKRHAAGLSPPGWGSAHFLGPRRGDCATFWKRSSWHLVRSWVRPLTFAPFRAGHRWAQVTILRGHGTTVAVVCVHLVTRGHWPTYRRGIVRLQRLLASLQQPQVVVGGDWNAARWRAHLRWPCTHSWRTGPRAGRDDRLCWHHAHLRSQRLLGHTYSDHDGVRARLGP